MPTQIKKSSTFTDIFFKYSRKFGYVQIIRQCLAGLVGLGIALYVSSVTRNLTILYSLGAISVLILVWGLINLFVIRRTAVNPLETSRPRKSGVLLAIGLTLLTGMAILPSITTIIPNGITGEMSNVMIISIILGIVSLVVVARLALGKRN